MSPVAKPLLAADDISVRLGGRVVVDHVSFALAAGQLTALIGPNGAGKTSLIRALAGLVPTSGNVTLAGRQLTSFSARERARRIAYLPQGHVFHWPMSVAQVIALGRHPHADAFVPFTQEDRAAVDHAMRAAGVEALSARTVTTLSGGERARVALARALATRAPILLADEPTVALDPRHQLMVMELLAHAARAEGGAVLAVVHDLALAARFADRVLVLERGALVADGPPREVLTPARIAAVFAVEAGITETAVGAIPILHRPL
ncbi:MAG: ABC transporter ATP-binding protein [Hyphomicrobiales bacterium]|nr:ABC transporter ATP-binding protein [Hyphomicrobiales bacterium]